MQRCDVLASAFDSITVWQHLNGPTRVHKVIGIFTCSPQIQTENMNFKQNNVGSGRNQYLYKVLEITAFQRHYVIIEEMFELRCRCSCSEYCAVKPTSVLG